MLALLPHACIHKLIVMKLTSSSSSLIILARVSISSRSLLTSLRSASSSGRIFAISSFRSSFSFFCHPKKCELVIFPGISCQSKGKDGNSRHLLVQYSVHINEVRLEEKGLGWILIGVVS